MKNNLRALAQCAVEGLERLYPDAACSLTYEKPYELLIATRLSAQCTDARVNIVTKVLFERFPTLQSIAEADVEEIEEIVRPCGLYKTKAKSISKMAKRLIADYGGELPDNMEELTSLPGVGRKTANLVMGDVFGKPAVVTDTHCIRICGRLGLTESKEPAKVEKDLWAILPPEKSSDFCHRLVVFGRETCTARSPKCGACPLRQYLEDCGMGCAARGKRIRDKRQDI
ncbi:MAG: endonuclease III [Oscillospiraceae bacterium]|nr:endonuclease III [Oscillospiraceae bacterium]